MKEPILSREEVGALWTELSGRPFVDGSLADAFAERLESAILEKLCGEPAAEVVREYFAGRIVWDFKVFDRDMKHGTKLYTLKDRQS